MRRLLFPLILVALCVNTVGAQPTTRPVEIVNLPPVLQVTGEELRLAQQTLALLLLRTTGTVPEGLPLPQAEECEVTGVADLWETAVDTISTSVAGCHLDAYADVCASAARRHRERCAAICEAFTRLHSHESCRGNAQPTIEPFSTERHCFTDPVDGPSITCVVTGWCSCDP